MVVLILNERRVAEDRRGCYWLYVVTKCNDKVTLFPPINDPGKLPWGEVVNVQHNALNLQDFRRLEP